jgi:hypothetical protein
MTPSVAVARGGGALRAPEGALRREESPQNSSLSPGPPAPPPARLRITKGDTVSSPLGQHLPTIMWNSVFSAAI